MTFGPNIPRACTLHRLCAAVQGTDVCAVCLTGGAISNMYSVMIARYKYFPEVKTKGMSAAPRLVLFTSEHVSDHTETHTHTLYISGNLTMQISCFIDCRLIKVRE